MTKPFRTLDDADVAGKRVLLRVDLNVPTEERPRDRCDAHRAGRADHRGDRGQGRQGHPSRAFRPSQGRAGRGQFAEARRRGGRRRHQPPGRLCRRQHRQDGGRRDRQNEERRRAAASRTPASTRARRRTIRLMSRSSPSSATSMSTTPSPPPTAPTPRPKGSPISCRPTRGGRCRRSSRRWSSRSAIRLVRWRRSSAGRKCRPSSTCSAIS